MLRIFGIILIVTAELLFCMQHAKKLTGEYVEWCQVRFLLLELLQNNAHVRKVIEELLKDVLSQMDCSTHVFQSTKILYKSLKQSNTSFEKEWQSYSESLIQKLQKHMDFWIHFKELSIVIDRKTPEVIEQYLKQNIEMIEAVLQEEKEKTINRKKVWNSISCLFGVIIILLLI